MKYKKIYIEITNICNLNCPFCGKTKKTKKEMTPEEYEHILTEISPYTDYISLHIKGEPLLHSKLEKIFDITRKHNKKIVLTTNGTKLHIEKELIIKNSDIIKQINISIHALLHINYPLDEIISTVNDIHHKTNIIFSYRLWNKKSSDEKHNKIFENLLTKYYQITSLDKDSVKLDKNIYLNKDNIFVWPDLENDFYQESGTCYGLRSHLGILSDGTIVPCCLDSEGIINLGNIFTSSFKTIINSKKAKEIEEGFQNNKKLEELCKKCSFIETKKQP